MDATDLRTAVEMAAQRPMRLGPLWAALGGPPSIIGEMAAQRLRRLGRSAGSAGSPRSTPREMAAQRLRRLGHPRTTTPPARGARAARWLPNACEDWDGARRARTASRPGVRDGCPTPAKIGTAGAPQPRRARVGREMAAQRLRRLGRARGGGHRGPSRGRDGSPTPAKIGTRPPREAPSTRSVVEMAAQRRRRLGLSRQVFRLTKYALG